MLVDLNSKELVYTGRIDVSNPKKPVFIYPSSSLRFRFFGKKAEIVIRNRNAYWNNSVGAIIDGHQRKWDLLNNGQTNIVLVDEEQPKEHNILFFKRMDSCHIFTIESLNLSNDSWLLKPDPRPVRRIEVYGDSVSAGEVSEAEEYAGKTDPEHNGEHSNSWYSYSWITARKLDAEIHNISQGGIPLLNGTGWVEPPLYLGMESIWDKLNYHPKFGEPTDWDFFKYTPQVVIVAIGQNDSNPVDFMKEDFHSEKSIYWREKYKQFISDLRYKYTKAVIILTTTILYHDKSWDNAIEQVRSEINDNRIKHFMYSNNGKGTPGHIRASEAEKMAEELSSFINSLDSVWN